MSDEGSQDDAVRWPPSEWAEHLVSGPLSARERAGFLREALLNGDGVAKRLIVALVLFSSVITTVITAIELHASYERDLGRIDRSLEFIGKNFLPALIDDVWVADSEQVQTILDGWLRLPDIEYIGVAVQGQLRWSAGQVASQRKVEVDVPMVREHLGKPLTIGTLRVVASVDRVLARLWDHLLFTLLSNGLKTFLVAGFMLLVFQVLVARHLTRIAAFVRAIDPAAPRGEQIGLDRKSTGRWHPDILDTVTGAINGLSRSLHDAHEDLRRSDERLRALTRETTAFIYEIDRDGRIVFANRTYSLPRERVEGTRIADLMPAEFAPRIESAIANAFAGVRLQRLQYTVFDDAGQAYSHIASIMPIQRDGVVTSAALTSVDISEQKAAEQAIRDLNASLEERVRARTAELQQAMERAESANRAKSEFLSRMSHELRTPMNAVLGFAQIIEMSDPTPKQLQWAGEIRRAGDHLLRMIDDLLDLARIEAGKMSTRIEALDLQPVIAESVAIVMPLITSHRLRLVHDLRGVSAQVLADRLRLRQVLVNLLTNAVKYNRENGEIRLRCEQHGDSVRLSVADTGMGIAPALLDKLFQPFERLGAEFGSVEGTGIGLALSRQLADLMGATLGVDSSVGIGSTFWIDMRHAALRAVPTSVPAATCDPITGSEVDLLYVEDKVSNIELIEACLAHYPNVRLRTALNGRDGLTAARARAPDIIVLDIQLPGTNGYQVLEQLRADARLRRVPVIAVSADAMPHDIERGLAAGFDRYLAKPVDLDELLRTLGALLRERRQPA